MSEDAGDDVRSLAAALVQKMEDQGKTLAVAESSTGGLIGHLLTEVPGSSSVFLGGVIAYHNRLKERLGVPAEVLEKEGAVSAATAEGMAEGVRRQAGADFALAVTGIAGPGGGTQGKPVGLTFVALATDTKVMSESHIWHGGRSENKLSSAKAALLLLRDHLESQQ